MKRSEKPANLRDEALRYASYGWRVFPLHDADKRPRIANWRNDASSRRRQIKRWWAMWPDANVAILCDSVNGPLVLDLDRPKRSETPAEDLLRVLNVSDNTCEVRTGSGGRHLYFAPPVDGRPIPRSIRVRHKNRQYALDVLGDAGYVVAPPSIHPDTGKRYRVRHGRLDKLAPFPREIERILRDTEGSDRPVVLPDVIAEGERDTLLTSLAGSMRRRGASEEAILSAIRTENAQRVQPPLAEPQLRKIARSISKKRPVPLALDQPINDTTLAARFADIEKHSLRYSPAKRQWYLWDGTRWAPDKALEVERRVDAMVRSLFEILQDVPPDRRSKLFSDLNKYSNHPRLRDVLTRARSLLVITQEQLDSDPWVFNVLNGTVDLRTGKLRPHRQHDYITKRAPVTYDRAAKAPQWKRFIDDITVGDAELAEFLQYAVGYTLAGVIREHVLFFCYGSGRNGKSTFLEVLRDLFGDYGVSIDFETLLQGAHRSNEARRDLPRLHNARLATATESNTQARWDEAIVKQLTGGDTLSGRWLYGEKFEFTPTHSLWCCANAQPDSRDQSEGFWSRIRLIPFRRRFKGKNQIKDLRERLRDELPGILNWALRGCLRWQKADGLPPAQRVAQATAQYRSDQDDFGLFIENRCDIAPTKWTPTEDLYAAFQDWWRNEHGVRSVPPSSRAFGKGLAKQRNVFKRRRGGRNGWLGLRLRDV